MKGSIAKRGKASWRLKFDVPGADGERKTHYITMRGSKKDAQAKLTEQLAAVGKGTFIEPNKLTIAAHVEARIKVWRAAGVIGEATNERYSMLAKRQIAPHLGHMTLQQLGTADVEGWHTQLRTAGLSPRTVRHAHALLRKALGDAVRHGRLTRNVCGRDGERAPTVPKKKMELLKGHQIDEVVVKLRGTTIYAEAILALFCGLRAGEILALGWHDVDLDGKVLRVRGSVEEVAGQPLKIKRPKTEAGIRELTMPDIVVEALRDHRRQQLEQRMLLGLGRPAEDALVFSAAGGGLSRRTGLSIRWAKTAEALGLPDIVFHSLRHSHASMLVSAKVDIVTIATRLGHADPAITLRVYSHLYAKNDAVAADAINAALGANSVPKTA